MQQFIRRLSTRVRYAPSPTGYLHLGGLRTALFNYLYAKASDGKFILRIEDTDKSRQVEGSIEALQKSLAQCGISPDEGPESGGSFGPYIQSQRLEIYSKYAQQLVDDQHAYPCFCTSERLSKLRESQHRRGDATMYDRACLGLSAKEVETRVANGEPHTIRLKVPDTDRTTIKDLIRGYVQFNHRGIDDQILIKSDGYPTYHLASVVDDHLMQISHVIRGEEWLSSTPKHVILYKALGFSLPQFAHLGLLLNADRSKLSKRQGDVAVEDFLSKGYVSEALVNFVALLGWNPSEGETKELFSMKELIERFELRHVNSSGSIVDVNRLRWMNSHHMREQLEQDDSDLFRIVKEQLEKDIQISIDDQEYLIQVLRLMREKVGTVDEFLPLCRYFFQDVDYSTEAAESMRQDVWESDTHELLTYLMQQIEHLDEFTPKSVTSALKTTQKHFKKKSLKSVLMPVRYCLTGSKVGAGIGDTAVLLGRKTTLERLKGGISF